MNIIQHIRNIIRKTSARAALFIACACIPALSFADEKTISLFLTANLNGGFTTSIENQEDQDPMLLLGQSLLRENKQSPSDVLIDLGNAFYPGLLSRFSYGSVMMDFLEDFSFAATLISSRDLVIGINNLEFLSQDKKTALLSANILKSGVPVFAPYLLKTIKGKTFAFIGITSDIGTFDVAEKNLLNVSLKDREAALGEIIETTKQSKVDYLVLLSGLSIADNLALMEKFKEIALCISGGDNEGDLYATRASRVDMESGRSLVTLTNANGFYVLDLATAPALAVQSLRFVPPARAGVQSAKYDRFVTRLTYWKKQFAQEGDATESEDLGREIRLDDVKAANFMRYRYNAEVAILEKDSIHAGTLAGRTTYSDILRMVDNEFPLFTYKISGSELKKSVSVLKDKTIVGTDGEIVQGRPIEAGRNYRICSTQSVHDALVKVLGREIPYKNTWKTLSDEMRTDLKGKQILAKEDFGFLEDRFRVLMDVSLSNFYDRATISRGENISTPPGKPAADYKKWGMEDKIDLTVYNAKHAFVLTPYVYYARQDDDYNQNLLRGTLLYSYNIHPNVKPYQKSQVDTVVEVEEDDLRPYLIRETAGVLLETDHINGKIGLGVEKQTQDPAQDMFSGLETIVNAEYEFWKYMTYSFNLDSFFSMKEVDFEERQIRSEVTNALAFKLNSFLSFSFKHKWFYFYSMTYKEKYIDSQILSTLDLNTDFKLY